MKFTFSKEILENETSDRLYHILNDETPIGKFYCGANAAFFYYEEKGFVIDIKKYFFKSSEYNIIDKKTNQQIGKYDINYLWNTGSLIWNDNTYTCKRMYSGSWFSLRTKKYKIKLFNDKEEVIYWFVIKRKNWLWTPNTEFSPGEGKIVTNTNDLFLLFSGFFLMEQIFNKDDSSI